MGLGETDFHRAGKDKGNQGRPAPLGEDEVIILAIDPATTTGWAFWGSDGLISSGAGSYVEVADILCDMPLADLGGLFIESAFIGVNKRSGLTIASIGGFFEGLVYAVAGKKIPTMKVGARTWRTNFGWQKMKRDEAKDAAKCHASVHKDDPSEDEAEAICMAQMAYELFMEKYR